MYDKILRILESHFTQYSDYKLGKIAKEICDNIDVRQTTNLKSCSNCMHSSILITTYVGESPNLCQKGRMRGNATDCPYYCKDSNFVTDDYTTISYTLNDY